MLLHCFGIGKDLVVGHVQSNSAKSICTDTIQCTLVEFIHLMKTTNGMLSKSSSRGNVVRRHINLDICNE
jgi:hypothetical protein